MHGAGWRLPLLGPSWASPCGSLRCTLLGFAASRPARPYAGVRRGATHPAAVQKTSGVFCAAQLYGAKHGLSVLPAETVYRIDVLEALLELAGERASAALSGGAVSSLGCTGSMHGAVLGSTRLVHDQIQMERECAGARDGTKEARR